MDTLQVSLAKGFGLELASRETGRGYAMPLNYYVGSRERPASSAYTVQLEVWRQREIRFTSGRIWVGLITILKAISEISVQRRTI